MGVDAIDERWVNAYITIVVPLEDIRVTDSAEDKAGATTIVIDDLIDRLGDRWLQDVVLSGCWKDVVDGEPIGDD